MQQRPRIVCAEGKPLARGVEETRHLAMLDQDTLRPPGRARCVNAIGEVLGPRPGHRVVGSLRRELVAIRIESHDGARKARGPFGQRRRTDEHRRGRVREHERQALQRKVRIERQIGAAGLHHREHGHDHVQSGLEQERNQNVRPDAQTLQAMRDPVRAGVQLPVSHLLAVEGQRDAFRRGGGSAIEDLCEGPGLRPRRLPAAPTL